MNKDHKDRGMKKWHGFFMPESIKMLKDLWLDDLLECTGKTYEKWVS